MSAQGDCYDNARSESFFATLKGEAFTYHCGFATQREAAWPSLNTLSVLTIGGGDTARWETLRRMIASNSIFKISKSTYTRITGGLSNQCPNDEGIAKIAFVALSLI